MIVQPSRIPVRTETVKRNATDHKVEQQPPKDAKPKFLFESKLSSTLVNSLFNSANQEAAKLRPSVLRINEASSTANENDVSDGNEEEEASKDDPATTTTTSEPSTKPATNLFKFAPLTDNKKSTFGSSFGGSSITSSSCALASSSSLSGLSSTNKSSGTPSFLTNNGDNKPTNYFTENLFQAAAQSTSNNSPESSTFSIASSNSESAGFVFGQNLQDRVTNIVEKPRPSTASTAADTSEPSTSQADDAASAAAAANSQLASGSGTSEKRKFENITGEEEETNVMHIYCKLFHWDSDQSAWKERGKGNLRLNDKYDEERTSSRLIMRTAGSLKLILNCLIIRGMKFELTNDSKCLRFSNVDGIYLIKGKQMDIEQIYSLIEQRLRLLPKKSRAELKQIDEDEHLNRDQIERLRLNKDDDEDSLINTSNTSDGRPEESSFKSLDTSGQEDEARKAVEDSGDDKSDEEESPEAEATADKPDESEESDAKDEAGEEEEDREQKS